MINYKKPLIFTITKINRNGEEKENELLVDHLSSDNKNRLPWTKEEDDAVINLVKQVGTKNWTILSRKMREIYSFNHRTGKQCRERWHNHLDPYIKKDYWGDEEERVLMLKHMEHGNKWSEIARFLPGRTDNTIKNHFYSKLRKFIRKIVKVLHRDNVFQENSIDPSFYSPDRIYKLIKKQKIPYDSLSKDSIIDLILKHDIHNNNGSKSKRESHSKGFKNVFKPMSRFSSGFTAANSGSFKKAFKRDFIKNGQYCEESPNSNCGENMKTSPQNFNIMNQNSNVNPNLSMINSHSSINNQLVMNNINALNQLISTINMPNNNNNSSNMNTESEENFTVKLIQNLNELSNANSSKNNMGNNYFLSGSNTDNMNMNCFNYPQHTNRNLIPYPYDSLNELYTMNMSRIIPQMNDSMGNFTLANNSFNSLNQEKKMTNKVILKEGESESNNNQISEMLLNNMINNPSIMNKPNSYFNNNEDIENNCNINRNLSFSLENDILFNPDNILMNSGNIQNSKSNTSRSFHKIKSFNCVEPDVLHDDVNNGNNIFLNNSSINMKTCMAPCFPFANINTNTPNSFEISNFEKFKNFCEIQQSIFNKNSQSGGVGQVQGQGFFNTNVHGANIIGSSLGNAGSQSQINKSPTLSPKSAFLQNYSQNYSHNLSNLLQFNMAANNTSPSNI